MSKRPYWLREDYENQVPNEFLVYPKRTLGVIGELALRGLRCSRRFMRRHWDEIEALLDAETPELWSREEIDALADLVNDYKLWDWPAQFCQACDLRFGQVVEAYRNAVGRDGSGSLTFALSGLAMRIEPAASPADYAKICFFSRGPRTR